MTRSRSFTKGAELCHQFRATGLTNRSSNSSARLAWQCWTQPLGAALAKLRPTMAAGQVSAAVMAGMLALLVYQLIVVLYMLSARASFGVGVKDDRPLWERAQRR